MGLLKIRQLTEAEILASLNSRRVIKATPEERFETLKTYCRNRGQRFRKYHFKAIVNDGKIWLFNGNGKNYGSYEKTNSGYTQARKLALEIFCAAVGTDRNGGFKIDLCIGLRQINASMGISQLETLDEEEGE